MLEYPYPAGRVAVDKETVVIDCRIVVRLVVTQDRVHQRQQLGRRGADRLPVPQACVVRGQAIGG